MHIAFAYTRISRPHAHTNHTTIPSHRFTPAPAVQSISTIRPYPRVPQAATDTGLASGHEPQLKILRTTDVIQMVVPLLYRAVPCCTLLFLAVPYCTVLYLAVPCCTLLYLTVPCCTLLYRVVPCCTLLFFALAPCV